MKNTGQKAPIPHPTQPQTGGTDKPPTKHPQPPDHCLPLTPSPSCSLTLPLQLFSASLINWSCNHAKSASHRPLSAHSSPWWKMAAFPKTISSWPIIKSHTDNAWLSCWQKQTNKQKGCMDCWKMPPVLILCRQTGVRQPSIYVVDKFTLLNFCNSVY